MVERKKKKKKLKKGKKKRSWYKVEIEKGLTLRPGIEASTKS